MKQTRTRTSKQLGISIAIYSVSYNPNSSCCSSKEAAVNGHVVSLLGDGLQSIDSDSASDRQSPLGSRQESIVSRRILPLPAATLCFRGAQPLISHR